MALHLRPYQTEARRRIHAEWEAGHQRTLLVLPTGTGKTVVFAAVAEDCVRAGQRVLVLAHRGELLAQAADKIYRSTGLRVALEQARHSSLDSPLRITVGSVQSLGQEKRLAPFAHDWFGAIIIDEAHHAVTGGYRQVLDWFPQAQVLGAPPPLTAAICRTWARSLTPWPMSTGSRMPSPRATFAPSWPRPSPCSWT